MAQKELIKISVALKELALLLIRVTYIVIT